MESKNLTLGFDATTQEGVHINSVHYTTTTKCHVVAIDQLAGGTAEDYEQHISQAIDHLASTYADYHQVSYDECRSTIIANISNSMSDRAAVNHATIRRLNSVWGKSINELNCHLHPLDTIATACRSAMKGVETKKGMLLGTDCMAGNIILQINQMRYKDGKGDPRGFTTFLDDYNLPKAIIPRYRGNRLHVLFHTAGILIQHHDLFLGFLTTGTVSCGKLQASPSRRLLQRNCHSRVVCSWDNRKIVNWSMDEDILHLSGKSDPSH